MKKALLILVGLGLGACGPGGGDTGPLIRPHFSPVNFGNLPLQTGQAPDPGCTRYAPCEWVLLLQNFGTAKVEVSATCVEGDSRGLFSLEGPVPVSIEPNNDGAVRITYSGDKSYPSEDNVALIVQSNAKNFPTLVVPICGRIVDAGTEGSAPAFKCQTPVSVEAGKSDPSFCK